MLLRRFAFLAILAILAIALCPSPAHAAYNTFICSYSFSDADAPTMAGRYGVVVTSLDEAAAVSTIKAANPSAQTLFYKDSQTYGTSYYVYDTVTGKKIVNRSWGWYLHDISNASYRSALASSIASTLAANPQFTGVFLDDCWTSLDASSFYQEGTTTAPNLPADLVTNWQTYMVSLIQAVKAALGTKLVILNTGWYATNYLAVADGQMDENFAHANWDDPGTFLDVNSWLNHINALKNASLASKYYLAQSGVGDGATPAQIDKLVRYSYASFLMGIQANGYARHYFCPSMTYSNDYWYPYWTVDLGTPSGAFAQVASTTAYRRDFALGISLANPSASAASVTLEKTYYTLDGQAVTRVDLSDHDGALLLSAAPADTTPPAAPANVHVTAP